MEITLGTVMNDVHAKIILFLCLTSRVLTERGASLLQETVVVDVVVRLVT